MRTAITILLLLTAMFMRGQDSVALKVQWVKTVKDTTYYGVNIIHMASKEKVIVKCCCRDKTIRRKGELVMVAKKDLIFE